MWQAWFPGVLTALLLVLYGLVLLWGLRCLLRRELAVHTTLILQALRQAHTERLS